MKNEKLKACVYLRVGPISQLDVNEQERILKNMKNNKSKVAIYCSDNTELSVNNQEMELQEYCKQHGYIINDIYKDIGYGSYNKNRPNYNLMISDLKKKRINEIITTERSVLCWSDNDFIKLVNLTQELGCNIKFFKEKIDTCSQECISYVNNLKAIAQFEKEHHSTF